MTIYRYNGPINFTRMAHSPIKGKSHDFTFYKGELYEGKWINKAGDFGDFVLNSGEEIQCLDMTNFEEVRGIVPIKSLKTYSFRAKNLTTKEVINCSIDATSREKAQNYAMMDSRFKKWEVLLSTFRAQPSFKKEFEEKANKKFLKHLNLAIEAMYEARMENNAAVLSMPIKDLYRELITG